jgi:hypothetical protein
MYDLTRLDRLDGVSHSGGDLQQNLKSKTRRHDDDYRNAKQLAVLETPPAFFLHRPRSPEHRSSLRLCVRQLAAQLAGKVFVEENSLHAMFASSARPASSRNATACSLVTPG